MPERRREELIAFCTSNRLPIIEDGAYQELCYEGNYPKTLKSMDKTGMVMLWGQEKHMSFLTVIFISVSVLDNILIIHFIGIRRSRRGNYMKILGIGNTAEVYEYGAEKVCKLFKDGYPKEYVELEFQNAQVLNRLGLSVPKVYEIIEKHDRIGIVYERIHGKSLMEAIFEGKNTEMLFGIFIGLQKEILNEDSTELLSYKDFLIGSLKGKSCKNDMLEEKILALPEGNCICHGDFHPGNIILTPSNTAVIIDFMNACRGRREYDIARTYFLLTEFSNSAADSLGGLPISDIYLEQMNVKYQDIEQWVEVIAEYRKYE